MDHDTLDPGLKQQIKVMQIIAAALMMGVISFGVIAFKLGQGKQPPELPMMSYIAGGFGFMVFGMHFVVPTLITNQQVNAMATQGGDVRKRLAMTFQTKTIITLAMLEGAGFFGLICYVVEGHPISIGAAAFMLFCMSIQFPGTSRVVNWIESTAETIELKRTQQN